MATRQILIADDEPNLRRVLTAQLERDGYDVLTVENGEQALDALANNHFDLVITDLKMPKIDGMTVLKHVMDRTPDVPVILITAHGTVDNAVEALKVGAFDYVTKPFDRTEFRNVIDKAIRTRELAYKHVAPPGERGRYRIIGQAPPMQEVYNVIERVADTPSTVLVTGESGTGKELVARALHENSSRADKPFIKVNCAAIPPDLIESELFGYEKGAFTGAVTSKPGRFELADGGTLFLDEIGDVPPNIQVKLLRVLQEQEFERVGGIKTISIDVRLVAATNRDLRSEIAGGRFREDLFYRLNVVQVALPPLRDRTEDIPMLLDHFVTRFNARLGRQVRGFTDAARGALLAYGWPGNIRELENVVERCMLFCDGEWIELEHLPAELRRGRPTEVPSRSRPPPARGPGPAAPLVFDEEAGLKGTVREATAKIERDLIAKALDQTGGNVTRAARLLKISRKSLQTKMKELGLREEDR